jgi:hypothetical protein
MLKKLAVLALLSAVVVAVRPLGAEILEQVLVKVNGDICDQERLRADAG